MEEKEKGTSIIKLMHEDHMGNISHVRMMGSVKTVGSLVLAVLVILLETFTTAKGIGTLGGTMIALFLGSKSTETLASQSRAAKETVAKINLKKESKKDET